MNDCCLRLAFFWVQNYLVVYSSYVRLIVIEKALRWCSIDYSPRLFAIFLEVLAPILSVSFQPGQSPLCLSLIWCYLQLVAENGYHFSQAQYLYITIVCFSMVSLLILDFQYCSLIFSGLIDHILWPEIIKGHGWRSLTSFMESVARYSLGNEIFSIEIIDR